MAGIGFTRTRIKPGVRVGIGPEQTGHGRAGHTSGGGPGAMPRTRPGRLHGGMNADATAVLVESLTRTYGNGSGTVTALDRVTLAFPAGSFTAVMGPSGSGKSTLLQCAAGLDRAGSGGVTIGGGGLR